MKYKNRIISLTLCLLVALTMCFGSIGTVFAGDGAELPEAAVYDTGDEEALEEALPEEFESQIYSSSPKQAGLVTSGTTITPNAFTKTAPKTAAVYTTASDNSTFNVKLASAGTLLIIHNGQYSSISAKVNGSYPARTSTDSSGAHWAYFNIGSAGNASLNIDSAGTSFELIFAPSVKTVTAGKSVKPYYLGASSSGAVRTLKVKVPAKGLLYLNTGDAVGTSATEIRTKGFKDYEYLTSNDATRYIGVKKGTYTIKIKSYASVTVANVKFIKKSEAKAGTKKSSAFKLKKKKTATGIIVTDKKKVHWYKIKNPKNQKMTLVVKCAKMSRGNSSSLSGLKLTLIYPNKSKDTGNASAGKNTKFHVEYGTWGTTKARKGTYYLKVESTGGGTGLYTITWK